MITLTASKAHTNFYRLIDELADLHEPLLIIGKRNNSVLISESDWTAIQETLHLLPVPSKRKSNIEGMQTLASELPETLDW